MTAPEPIACPADTWTKVATAVQSGIIAPTISNPDRYLHDWRPTGVTGPLDSDHIKKLVFNGTSPETIEAYIPIDIYVYPVGAAGEVLALT